MGFPSCAQLAGGAASFQGGAVSPDGSNLYLAGRDPVGGIAVFSRDPATGAISQLAGADGCVTASGNSGACRTAVGMGRIWNVAVAPDGATVYATSSSTNAVLAFDRTANGALVQRATNGGCIADAALGGCAVGRTLASVTALAISPDSKHVYAGGEGGITVITAGAVLAQPAGADGCVDNDGAIGNVCADAPALPDDDVISLSVTPNGVAVLAAAGARAQTFFSQGTSVLSLIRSSATGALTPRSGPSGGCAAKVAGADSCVAVAQLDGTQSIVAGPGSTSAYVASHITDSVVGLALGLTGEITGTSSCVSHVALTGCTAIGGIDGAIELAATPEHIYVASYNSRTITPLARQTTGALGPNPTGGCIKDPQSGTPCTPGPGANTLEGIVASPDDKTIYALAAPSAGGGSGVGAYKRDLNATDCADTTASTAFQTPVTVSLACSDGDGDPLTIEIVTPPANGSLGAVDSANRTVTFGPLPSFSGRATFTYRAHAAGLTTRTATAAIDVGSAPCVARVEIPGNGVDEDCDGTDAAASPPRIKSPITARWRAGTRFTRMTKMTITAIPARGTVEVRCSGKGCPFKKKRFKPSNKHVVNAHKAFRNNRLRPKAKIEVRITAPGRTGKVVTYTIRAGKSPKTLTRCLPPGRTKPTTC